MCRLAKKTKIREITGIYSAHSKTNENREPQINLTKNMNKKSRQYPCKTNSLEKSPNIDMGEFQIDPLTINKFHKFKLYWTF